MMVVEDHDPFDGNGPVPAKKKITKKNITF